MHACILLILTIWLRVIAQGRIIIPATKDRFTNNLPDLISTALCTHKYRWTRPITSNMGNYFLQYVRNCCKPIKLKKVRENVLRHGTTVIPILSERYSYSWAQMEKSNLEVFRNCVAKTVCPAIDRALKNCKNRVYPQLIGVITKTIQGFLFSTVARLTNKTDVTRSNIPSQFIGNDFMKFLYW